MEISSLMSSVYFEQFESLWKRVEEKFISENNDSFTLDNLRNHLISRNLLTNRTDLKPIETYLNSDDKPPSVNLSNTIFNALNKYVETIESSDPSENAERNKTLHELLIESIKKTANKTQPKQGFSEIGFLGRKSELFELESFLLSPENHIFALYGVPMIGKSKLVSHFLENSETAKTYKIITVKLNPNPENTELKIRDEIFDAKEFNDFSGFSSNNIIVIQNFEETLKWTGNPQEVHDVKDEYENIKTFLKKVSEISSIKLILESRFQIHFQVFLDDWRTKVKTLPDVQLKGVEKDEFWLFYESKGFSYQQFEQLCENFDNHTGLLALAYNDVEFLYQNRLIEAFYEPTVVTRLLWNLVERLIDRLANREIWILCALTFLQEPVKKENLYEDFLTLPDFEDELQIGDSFNSLANKLLVQLEKGFYDLNPYIREVCYTFLKVRRKLEIQSIKNLPYFKKHGKTPYYDEIRIAQERGDYLFLLRLGQNLRKGEQYKEAINILEASLDINPKKEVVLNEIAITYKWQKNWTKAIETLKKALEYDEDNVIVLNELGICYREDEQLDKAIKTLEEARAKHPDNVKILNELAICYRENHELNKAIKTLEKARERRPNDVKILNELGICYQENKNYENSIRVIKKAIELKDYKSYSVLITTYKKMGDIKMAFEAAKEGMRVSSGKDSRLISQFQELEKFINQQEEDEKRIKKPSVFLSYSNKDDGIKEELDVQLSGLKRSNKISTWNDGKISPGTEWDNKIKQELDNADIILLLVSADFIASEYIWNIEIKRAIEKHEKGEALVIPIFCRACDFSNMPFAKLQGLPKDTNFIMSQPNKDEALAEVAKGIRKVVDDLLG